MASQQLPLEFPFNGIIETTAYSAQVQGSTFDSLNVRPFDSLLARKRGGQRAGIEKYVASAVNGSNTIQQIRSVAMSLDSGSIVADTLLFSRDFSTITAGDLDTVDPNVWQMYDNSLVTRVEGAVDEPRVADDGAGTNILEPQVTTRESCIFNDPLLTVGSAYIIKVRAGIKDTSGSGISILVRADVGVSNDAIEVEITVSGTLSAALKTFSTGSNITLDSGSRFVTPLIIGTVDDPQDYELHVNGNAFKLLVNGSEAWTATVTTFTSNSAVGLQIQDEAQVYTYSYSTAITPASLRQVDLVIASGGNIYQGDTDGLSIVAGGTAAVGAGEVWLEAAFQKVYTMDALSTGYGILDGKTRILTDWQTSITAGALPTGGVGVANAITAVSSSAKTFTVAEDLSSLTAGDFIEVRGSTGNDRSYTVASDSGTGPTVITVNETIPDENDTVDGNLYISSVGCRFAALYRGRIVMSGLETDPQNWFMSAAGNPLDWDYNPTPFVGTQADAGNTNQGGTTRRYRDGTHALSRRRALCRW